MDTANHCPSTERRNPLLLNSQIIVETCNHWIETATAWEFLQNANIKTKIVVTRNCAFSSCHNFFSFLCLSLTGTGLHVTAGTANSLLLFVKWVSGSWGVTPLLSNADPHIILTVILSRAFCPSSPVSGPFRALSSLLWGEAAGSHFLPCKSTGPWAGRSKGLSTLCGGLWGC